MRNLLNILLCILLLAFYSCSDNEDKIIPSDIENIEAISGPGYIKLVWDFPDDGSIYYTKVEYYDPLLNKNVIRLSSIDTIQIPETRHKYGEYEFFLRTYSHKDTPNPNLHSIKAISDKKPITEVSNALKIFSDQLSTNAQEPSEGAIENLLDGDTGTFFHTAWSEDIQGPHWLQIELKNILQIFRFQYDPRKNGANKPVDFDLMGSLDGESWFLIKNFTKAKDMLPTSSTEGFKSPTIKSEKPFRFLRMVVNETNTGTVFWTMSEFRLYEIDIIDPEAKEDEMLE